MDIYEMIRDCDDDEKLQNIADAAIGIMTKEALRDNKYYGIIGPKIDINPLQYVIDENGVDIKKYYTCVNVWNGFIPLGTKMIYGGHFDDNYKSHTNDGHYYYLDDDSYIIKFYKYIRELKLKSEFEIIVAIHNFLRELFGTDLVLTARDRLVINKALLQSNGLYFDPVKEHSIKDFYGNGSAECTEIASVGENLLTSLGFNAIYIQDKGHAFNIVVLGEEEKSFYVVDFANWVEYYDEKYHLIDTFPFFRKIEGATSKDLDLIANEGKRITLQDYYYYEIGGKPFEIVTKKTREYGADYSNEEDKPLNIKKIKHI